jgi:hypothetical protein
MADTTKKPFKVAPNAPQVGDTTTASNTPVPSKFAQGLGLQGGIGKNKTGAGVNDWKIIPQSWTPDQIKQYQAILDKAGAYGNKNYINGVWNPNVDGAAFKQVLAYVNPKSQDPTVTNWQNVMTVVQKNPEVFKQALGGGGAKDGTFSQVSQTVNQLSDTDAQDYVQKNFMTVHSRMPNPAELDYYSKKLKDAVASNASVTNTNSTYANGKLVSSKSTSTGGLNANQFMLNLLRADAPKIIKSDRAAGISDTASANLLKITDLAAKYGINVPDQHLLDLSDSVTKGKVQMADAEAYVRGVAATAFPAYSDQILNKGLTVQDIAAPYIGSMAKLLELDPNSISLNDNTIRSALSAKDTKGQPTTTPIYDFEKQLRNDPRWLKTTNAKQSVSNLGLQFAQDMGVAY